MPLTELVVRDLGVIDDLRLVLGSGMTAVTGETGAGKTLLVEAISLLVGGRSDATRVRAGAAEAWVEGRFVDGEEEVVLARAVPAAGRSRAYIDGHMVPVQALAEAGAALVELHGQHAHQALLAPATQRAALDRFGGIDLDPLHAARRRVQDIDDALAQLGGDERARAREIDLLRFQVAELDDAQLRDPDEDEALDREEDALGDAAAHAAAAAAAAASLADDGGGLDGLRRALTAVTGRAPLDDLAVRLRSLLAEGDDLAAEARAAVERFEEDPERLASIRGRRQLLRELRRKYGDTLADVIAYRSEARDRLADLESFEGRAKVLESERAEAVAALHAAEADVAAARRRAAPDLASAVEAHLRTLALPRARVEVSVEGPGAADAVTMRFSANAGEPLAPLAKVASGGELARAMLALRLVLTDAPPTLGFDEVDAGIGGAAAVAVGRALAAVAADHQVLVVTHLAQVAAFADHHIAVGKRDAAGRTVAAATTLDDAGRVIELSRMLSGEPDSVVARDHAAELLASAAARRGR